MPSAGDLTRPGAGGGTPDLDVRASRRSAMLARVSGNRRVAATLLVGNLALGVLGFVTAAAAAHLLGASGRGALAAIQNVPNLVAVFGALGLGEAALYLSAVRPGAARPITARALRIGLIGAAVATLVGWVVIRISLDDPGLRRDASLYLLVIPPTVAYTIAYQPLRALGRAGAWVGFRIAVSGGWLVCLVVALVLDRRSAVLVAMLFCVVMAMAAVLALAVARRYPHDEEPEPALSRRLLAFGLPNAVVVLPQAMNLRLDQVLLASLVSNTQLGLYVAAVGWSWIALPFFSALSQFTMPKIASVTPEQQDLWRRRIVRLAFLGAVGLFSLLVVPTRMLFPVVMGRQFSPGVNVATLMLAAGVLNGLVLVVEELCKGLGRPRRVLAAEMAGLGTTLLLLALLLRSHGIVGAAWASIGGYATIVVVLLALLPQSQRLAAANDE